jgi:hypothetical protein
MTNIFNGVDEMNECMKKGWNQTTIWRDFIFVVIFEEEIKRGIPIFLALSQVGNYWSISWDSSIRSFLHFLEWGIIEVCRGGQVASEHTSSEIWPTPIPPLSVSLGVIFGMVDFRWWPQKSFKNNSLLQIPFFFLTFFSFLTKS